MTAREVPTMTANTVDRAHSPATARKTNIKELPLSVTNCYLIETGKAYMLVDTGYEYDWGLFCKRLQEAGIRLSDISHVMLTHHHDDHCGLLTRIVRANNDVRVVMSYRARDLLTRGVNDPGQGARYVSRRMKLVLSLLQRADKRFAKQWKTHTFPPYEPRESDILIQGDTDLADIGIELNGRILETPGHSLDSISVLLDDGSCFVGDAASNRLPRVAGAKYCVVLLEDLDEYYRTWQKLLSAGARRIYPGHGKPFDASKLIENMGKVDSLAVA